MAGDGGAGTSDAAAGSDSGGGTVVGGVAVTVSPASVAVPPGGTKSFTCTVTGSANTGCTWQVTEAGGGTITAAGVYTGPATAGTYHVVASSVAQPGANGTAVVTVVANVIGACSALPAAGTWQNITPPSLNIAEWCEPYNGSCPNPGTTANGQMGTYGVAAFVLDPLNAGTIYLGTSSLGLWKSVDCGSTWVHIDTGQNAAVIDAGRNWTMVIDPTNSQVLYTVAGYGQGGVFKSTNGGVDWTQILTQNVLDATGAASCASTNNVQPCGGGGGFMERVNMDPTDNRHLLASFHSDCTGTPLPGTTPDSTGGWGCLAESTDAGMTWTLTTNALPWSGLDGPGQMMVDAKTWFFASNGSQGLWRTTTGGVSVGGQPAWTQVYSGTANGSVYIAKNGDYYSGGNSVIWSTDMGTTWTPIANSPNATGSAPIVDDGTTLYVGTGGTTYWTTPDSSPGGPFTMIASPPKPTGTAVEALGAIYIDVDAAHHVLYSSNEDGGFLRYVAQ
jgi:hypothetical protein